MYSDAFCKVFNEFGWNYFPQAFGEELIAWIEQNQISVETSMDLACGTGVLCEVLYEHGIEASGMDFSEGMIKIARNRNGNIHYDVADMILYRPDKKFDLVTCTGDAINHILDLKDIEQIFQNVNSYLNPSGYFIFDILNENEVSSSEPFDLDFDEKVKAQLQITRNQDDIINLRIAVYEDGEQQFEENITEIIHDPETICALLQKTGFQVLQCTDHLLEGENRHGTTWYIIAKKPE